MRRAARGKHGGATGRERSAGRRRTLVEMKPRPAAGSDVAVHMPCRCATRRAALTSAPLAVSSHVVSREGRGDGKDGTYLTLVVRRQPLVRLALVVEHPGEAAVWPVAPHGATRGPVAAFPGVVVGVAGGVLAAVGAPDDLGLVRARHASAARSARRSLGHYARIIAARLLTSPRESPPRDRRGPGRDYTGHGGQSASPSRKHRTFSTWPYCNGGAAAMRERPASETRPRPLATNRPTCRANGLPMHDVISFESRTCSRNRSAVAVFGKVFRARFAD